MQRQAKPGSGRVTEARRALFRQARAESDPQRRAAHEAELRDLRRWVEPSERPNLYSMSGFGAALFGHYQPEPDGTYVAILWFTLLGLPVFPLAAYLVRDSEPGAAPECLGRVPLPPGARITKILWVAALLVGVVFALARLTS